MPLVAIQCKNCGAKLDIDPTSKSYVCPYCHSSFVMEESVNQYITNNATTIGHVDSIIDDGSGKIDQEIMGGEALLRLKKYTQAELVFSGLTSTYAHKYKAWWDFVLAKTEEFHKDPDGIKSFEAVCDAAKSAIQLAPEPDKSAYQQIYTDYYNKWKPYSDKLQSDRKTKLKDISDRRSETIDPKKAKIKEIENTRDKKQEKLEKIKKQNSIIPSIATAVVAVIIILITNICSNLDFALNILYSVIISLIFILAPIKIVYAVIIKSTNVSNDIYAKYAKSQIEKINSDIEYYTTSLNNEANSVKKDTMWLDN